ncbi:hypothetical protein [Clostridium saccharoperbutylacetonicum]|uniref:hypothetical protein n=1 Tax=Clostridium saccharoperbutylacetonicum TaxID=36745 RepID=UPI0039E73FEA
MNGLTQIKEVKTGILYDVQYDDDYKSFIIWMHHKENFEGIYINSKEMKHFLNTKQIEITNDANNIISNNLK